MKIEYVTTTEHNIEEKNPITPDGWEVFDTYTPSHTITPWDYYGMKHVREIRRVLESAGINSQTAQTYRKIIHPIGSGPGGMVRFGDNMVPGTYYVYVKPACIPTATKAMMKHKSEVHDWLYNSGKMPQACA